MCSKLVQKTIVSKKTPPAPTAADIAGGININVTNANNSSATANTNVQAPMMGQPVYVGNGKPVNKVVYLLLCFFLGGLGGHKFYSGKVFAGIMYIVFVWTYIPSFLAFIEFIIGICKKADANGNIWV